MKKIEYKEASFSIPSSKIDALRKIQVSSKIVGQDRAVRAIQMGLKLDAPGFNIFVMGHAGTGRRTAISELLDGFKPSYKELTDIAYVYNFKKRLEPAALFFPGGEGLGFKNKLKQAVSKIVTSSSKWVRSENYLTSVNRIINDSNASETNLLVNFEQKMKAKGFKLIQIKQEDSPSSFDLAPLIDGNEITFQELSELVEQKQLKKTQFAAIKESYYACMESMNELFDSIRKNQEKTQKKLEQLLLDSVQPIIEHNINPLVEKVKQFEKRFTEDGEKHCGEILEFLTHISDDLKNKAAIFTRGFKNASQKKKFLSKYDINVICENSAEKEYVITENLPTFSNLFGTIENNSLNGTSSIDAHMRISPGACHKAFGGCLVLRFQDLITEDDAYFYLKRVLQSEKIEIQILPTSNNPSSVFKPVPIPAHFKVVLVGEANSYDMMYQNDPDFSKLFKICAEFSPSMIRTDENEAAFISLVDKLVEQLPSQKITTSGYAKLLEYACKLSGSRNFLSTQFTKISDIIIQANALAQEQGAKSIDEKLIAQTIREVRFLSSLPEQEYLDELKCGVIFIQVSGKKCGSINGLAVQDRGYFAFGVPEVITAQSSPGETGVINIESEVGFSGEIYDKAHLIISSLLKNSYAKDTKLSVDASVCFEQSYGMVEGDSASCAEFLALLSSISQIPFRQDLAITGSLNQHGDVQPIGGVSEKIEGFFKACQILGLSGTQGVVIPEANVQDLFLSEEVLEAIKEDSFSIYAVSKIDDVVKLFADCSIEEVSSAVKARLDSYNRIMKKLVQVEK